jgi:hypothetical protein
MSGYQIFLIVLFLAGAYLTASGLLKMEKSNMLPRPKSESEPDVTTSIWIAGLGRTFSGILLLSVAATLLEDAVK